MKAETAVKESLANIIGCSPSRIALYSKGRVGLYAILKSMGVGPGDEVVMPAYTCVVVPNAVKYLGARPVYVDIGLNGFSAEPADLLSAVNSKTKAVICQNTYGLSYRVDEIVDGCRKRGVWTVEDCTHGLSGTYKGLPNGSWCDAAFYSSQWNKPISSGIGGYSFVSDESLCGKVKEIEKSLAAPTLKGRMMLWALIRFRALVSPRNYYSLVALYRRLSKSNLVTGSSSGDELKSPAMPEDYLVGMGKVQMRAALRSMGALRARNAVRKANAAAYTDFLRKNDKNHVDPRFDQDHLFLKYPLLVRDRPAFVKEAKKTKIPLGDWFTSPLHPVEGGLEAWDFDAAKYPNAVFAAAHVVNIPTDTGETGKVLALLRDNLDNIYDLGEMNGLARTTI